MQRASDDYRPSEVRFGSYGQNINLSTSDLRLSNPAAVSESRQKMNTDSLLETTGSNQNSNKMLRNENPANINYQQTKFIKSVLVKGISTDNSLL
jgi:hypothetical protein